MDIPTEKGLFMAWPKQNKLIGPWKWKLQVNI